jgi:hypothetical protein
MIRAELACICDKVDYLILITVLAAYAAQMAVQYAAPYRKCLLLIACHEPLQI